jgi:threonine/homoserine/homoserine lactone efflux protein
MNTFTIVIKAIFTGMITGIVVSMPLGPTALESVKRTISKGFKEGFFVSLGAVSGDAFDLILINFGLFNILSASRRSAAIFWIISGAILTFMGYRAIKRIRHGQSAEFDSELFKKKDTRSMPFLAGFFMALSNPMNHSLWITLSGTVIRVWEHMGRIPYYTFMFSILFGAISWFMLLNLFVLKGHRKISMKSSHNISKVMMLIILVIGIAFILFGFYKLLAVNN